MLNYQKAPNHLGAALQRYIEQRTPLGGFMTAVVENNLREACAMADHVNQHQLWDIVNWLYNEAPSQCWGSPEKVKQWLSTRPAAVNGQGKLAVVRPR